MNKDNFTTYSQINTHSSIVLLQNKLQIIIEETMVSFFISWY